MPVLFIYRASLTIYTISGTVSLHDFSGDSFLLKSFRNSFCKFELYLTSCAIMAKLKQTYPKFYLYSRLVKAKLFIDRNYDNNINLHNIAMEGYFSKFHFIRLFKLIYGHTPHQYMMRVRIENAKELLRKDFSISDSCFKVGFDSITSFSGLFRKIEGKTPSEYQRAYRLRQENIKNKPQYFIPHCFAEQNGWSKNSNFREVI